MKTSSSPLIVDNVRLPICRYGFRSGYATATVNGVRLKLNTSWSDRTDYAEHLQHVTELFAAGNGEPE